MGRQAFTGVDQPEAARAVGVLTSPGWEHAWPTKAGLLVAENSGDGNARGRRERGFAVRLAARAHLRKHGSKNLKCRKQLFVSIQCF